MSAKYRYNTHNIKYKPHITKQYNIKETNKSKTYYAVIAIEIRLFSNF